MKITTLNADQLSQNIDGISKVLIDSVDAGGAIGFLSPLGKEQAGQFWMTSIYPEVKDERRVLFVATLDTVIVGTVQLLARLQPNQPHRCEIAKMMVHPSARRQGIGRALMLAAIGLAKSLGKTLVTLDTRSGDAAEGLYTSLGFEATGVVPDFAFNPDGKTLHSTTYMYRRI